MRRAFVYKAKLPPSAIRNAEHQLALCCELYNAAIEERREAWKQRQRVGFFMQDKQLPEIKRLRPEYAGVVADVLTNVLKRVNRAYEGFFRGGRGYPRFKSRLRYDSLTFRTCGWKLDGRRLAMRGIGTARLFLSRPIEGQVKEVTLRRDRCGDWWVSFSCDGVPVRPLPSTGASAGVDVGLSHFLTTSDGDTVASPRPYAAAMARLGRIQRGVSKQKKGGGRRRERVRTLARAHRRVANVRRDFHHKTALDLVRRYDLIAVEGLDVANMVRPRSFSRAISDAGWGQFLAILTSKAEGAGREVIAVNPWGTSQRCSECGANVPKKLSEREHICACGYVADRDVNAARNILALATGGAHPAASGLASEAAVQTRKQRRRHRTGNPSLVPTEKENGSVRLVPISHLPLNGRFSHA